MDNIHPKLATGGGAGDFFWVFNSFLTYYDFQGVSHPMMARTIPTRDNGDWVINPDGTMRTTYRLRENGRWHDGAPLTAHDFVFGYEVYLDRDLPVISREPETLMSGIEAVDNHTLVITWREPYTLANVLGYRELSPLPRHLLEQKYRTNKTNFTFGDEWTATYVGTGPFRVERWSPGSGVLARAHREWFLGAPKLEALDIRFISDASTLLANLLAGEVDMTNSPAVSAAEAVVARDQWVNRGQGYLKTWETRFHYLEFQHRDVPGWQSAVTDARVRQAMSHAVDRVALAEAITQGLGAPAEGFITRHDPLFPEVDRTIAKYPFDPQRAATLLAEAGWRPAEAGRPDASGRSSQRGQPVANAAGQALDGEIHVQTRWEQEATIVADNWKAVGITSSIYVLPPARERDREYRASFRAVHLGERTISPDNFYWVSGQIPTPESRFAELNRGSFRDVEVDRLHNVTITSFDARERRDAIIGLHKRMAELAAYIPLLYPVEIILARHAVQGPIGNYGPQVGTSWNVFEWQLAER